MEIVWPGSLGKLLQPCPFKKKVFFYRCISLYFVAVFVVVVVVLAFVFIITRVVVVAVVFVITFVVVAI